MELTVRLCRRSKKQNPWFRWAAEKSHFSIGRTLIIRVSYLQDVLSSAESPFPMLVGAHGTQEIYLTKGGPGYVAEIELAVCALPQQEAR